MKKQGRSLRLYVQVNIGMEPQKAGIEPRETVLSLTSAAKNWASPLRG